MAVALAVFCADTWTKAAVAGSYELGVKEEGGFITILHAQNPGVNFALHGLGVFPGRLPILLIAAGGVLLAIEVFKLAPLSRYAWIPAGLLMGAVLGNVLDLIANGYATDFIYIGAIGGTANVADLAAVSGGVGLLVLAFRNPTAFRRRKLTKWGRRPSSSGTSGT